LASGVLTGKYRRGETPPAGTRLHDQVGEDVRAKMLSDRTFTRLEALEAYAAGSAHSLLELAFAWLLGQPRIASVIAGASKPEQVITNAAAGGWKLTPEQVSEVTALVASA
jgi:aryl-alcohol dehydrogenase-like predicted oxidoreductase